MEHVTRVVPVPQVCCPSGSGSEKYGPSSARVPIPPAFGTGPLQALITQVRADWKFHRDIWLFIYDQPWL